MDTVGRIDSQGATLFKKIDKKNINFFRCTHICTLYDNALQIIDSQYAYLLCQVSNFVF